MKIIKAKDYNDMSRKAANIISAQVIMKPDCVLGLATGSTPIGTYKQLIEWYEKGDLDFGDVTTVNLDEYLSLIHIYRVDDYPYGGGAGMVMQAEPVYLAWESVVEKLGRKPKVLYMSPQGRVFDQTMRCV